MISKSMGRLISRLTALENTINALDRRVAALEQKASSETE
jgi:hypothetical protein